MKSIMRTAIFASLLTGAPCFAVDINLNGFATIAVGKSTEEPKEVYGYDYDTYFNAELDSLFGLQASADLGDGLEATVQIIAEGENDWDASFEWAFIGYELNDNWKVLFGRQRQPYYIYSDYVDVGYAFPWIDPPIGVYRIPFDSLDGIGIISNFELGQFESRLQLNYGRNQTDLGFDNAASVYDSYDQFNIAWMLTRDWLTLSASHIESTIAIEYDPIDQLANGWVAASAGVTQLGLTNVAASMVDAGAKIEFKDENASFTGIGIMLDFDKFLFVSEATQWDLDAGFLGKTEAYYATAAYRIVEDIQVHLTYGENETTPPLDALEGIPLNVSGGLVPQLDAGVNQLIGGTQQLLGALEEDAKYFIFGVRWDFHPSAAFKIEFTQYEDTKAEIDADVLRFAISTVF